MMNTTLQVTIKNVYGNEMIYSVCDQAKRLASLIGAKTFTNATMRAAMEMGFHFEYVDHFRAKYGQASRAMVA